MQSKQEKKAAAPTQDATASLRDQLARKKRELSEKSAVVSAAEADCAKQLAKLMPQFKSSEQSGFILSSCNNSLLFSQVSARRERRF